MAVFSFYQKIFGRVRLYPPDRERFFIIGLALAFALLGAALRFTGLDKKQFWKDEASTAMVITGHRIYDIFGEAHGGVFTAAEYFNLQNPSAERGALSTLLRVATEDSSHSPLYYLGLRGWTSIFGYSISSMRGFSAFLSLAILPAIFFLCGVLFESPNAGWIGLALTAVSPYQFLFAQESREYILWLLMTVLSSIALLKKRWGWYLCSSIIDIYVSLLTLFVAAGQIAFTFLSRDSNADRSFLSPSFYYARIAMILAGLPLFINLFLHLDDVRHGISWMVVSPSPAAYFRAFASELYRVFFDLNLPSGATFAQFPVQGSVIVAVLCLEAIALIFFLKKATRTNRIFLICLMLSALTPTVGLDLLIGGRRALSARFMLPFFLALQLLIVFLFTALLESRNKFNRRAGMGACLFVLVIGLFSIYSNCQSGSWWNKGVTGDYHLMAVAIDEAASPSILLSEDYRESLALSRYLNPRLQIKSGAPFVASDNLKNWKSIFILLGDPERRPSSYENLGRRARRVIGSLWILE